MVEVGEIEDLEVDPIGAGIGPRAKCRGDLLRRACRAVLSEFGGFASDGGGAPDDLVLVGSAAQHQRNRERHRRRVAIDGLAGGPDPIALSGEELDGYERDVELPA